MPPQSEDDIELYRNITIAHQRFLHLLPALHTQSKYSAVLFSASSPLCYSVNPTATTHGHFVLSIVSLVSRDQDDDLTENRGL